MMNRILLTAALLLTYQTGPQSFRIDDSYWFPYSVKLQCQSGTATTLICKQYQLSASPIATGRVEVTADNDVRLYAGKPEALVREWTDCTDIVVGTKWTGQKFLDSFKSGPTIVKVASSLSFYGYGVNLPENCGITPLVLNITETTTHDIVTANIGSSVSWTYCDGGVVSLPLATREKSFIGSASTRYPYERVVADTNEVRYARIASPYIVPPGSTVPESSTVDYRLADSGKATVSAKDGSNPSSVSYFVDAGTATLTEHENGSIRSIIVSLDSGGTVVYEFGVDGGRFTRTVTQ